MASVAPHGVVYVIARPRARRQLLMALQGCGFTIAESFLHVPDRGGSRFLIPIRKGPLRHALSELVPLRSRNRAIGALVSRLPSASLVAQLADPVGFAARPPDARPLFEWVGTDGEAVTAILARSLGAKSERVALHIFAHAAAKPSFVAKSGGSPDRAIKLAQSLQGHTAAARTAGAAVPSTLAPKDGESFVIESAVSGTNAAVLLARSPRRFPEVIDALVAWLDGWQELTAVDAELDRALLDEWVLAPACRLEGLLDAGRTYVGLLEQLCGNAAGRIPLVTVHSDLTMSNILVDRRRGGLQIGVVDWETVRPQGLPLLDLFYTIADASAAAARYRDRVASARDCFSSGGRHAARVSSARARLISTLGLSDEISALCFHACWLHHADNERLVAEPGEPTPFLEIVDWIAGSHELLPGLAAPAFGRRR